MTERRLFGDAVRAATAADPSAELLVWNDYRISRVDALERVDRLAKGLIAAGVETGDRVALLGEPRPDVFLHALAATDVGAIWLGLNPKYTQGELDHVVGDATPRFVFGFSNVRPAVAEALAGIGERHPGSTVITDWDTLIEAGTTVSEKDLVARREAVETTAAAVLVYTSGSSGRPKGALLAHGPIVHTIDIGIERKGLLGRTLVCNLPINHVGSLLDVCGRTAIGGGVIHFQERFDPAEMMACVARERLNCWGGVPTIFQVCLNHPDIDSFDLTSVDLLAWGGAAMPPDLLRALRAKTGAAHCTVGYGSTETTGGITFSGLGDSVELLTTTVGTPDDRLPFRIWHPDGRVADVGEAGEAQAHRSYTTVGYWGDEAATAAAFDGDWFRTGDLAVRRPDGRIELVGRLSEMFKSGGYNVYPREVEMALEAHPGVAIAAVVSKPDPTYQEVGHGYVVAESGHAVDLADLRAFARERLANYKLPKAFTVLDEMPRLAVGKIDKIALRARARTVDS